MQAGAQVRSTLWLEVGQSRQDGLPVLPLTVLPSPSKGLT